MKKFVIAYSSKTGNTKKVAEAMHSTCADNFDLVDIETQPDLSGYDMVVVGYWVDKGGPNAACMKEMQKLKNKMVVLFQTLGAEAMGSHAMSCAANGGASLGEGCKVLGVFSCQGAIDPELIERMRKMPAGGPHSSTPESEARWAAAASHPDEADLNNAKEFIQNVVQTYERFYKMMAAMHKK